MSKTHADLLAEVQERLNKQRRVERAILRPDFVEAFGTACEPAKAKAEELVAACDSDGINRWVQEQTRPEYGTMTLRDLRKIGQELGVPYYNNLPKASLLSEIVSHEQARQAARDNLAARSDGSYPANRTA
jgi:hypothetical protein